MIYLIVALLAGGVLAIFLCANSGNWRDGEETSVGERLVDNAEESIIANFASIIILICLIFFMFWICSTEIR